MRSIGVRELKAHASGILRELSETREEVQITRHGRAIARLVPLARAESNERGFETVWAEMDRLAEEIARRSQPGVTAADLIDDMRCAP